MSIQLPHGLPAADTLGREGLHVIRSRTTGGAQWLNVLLVNLMPDKATTERQFARLLGATSHAVQITLICPESHVSRNTPSEHIQRYYRTWSEVRHETFDGMIITGAPVELLAFQEVDYWPELVRILEWSRWNVGSSLHVCWAAQAALYHFHGVPKHQLHRKAFGLFAQDVVVPGATIVSGLEEGFKAPVSRHTEVRLADLRRVRELDVVASSPESGICLVQEGHGQTLYMTNHLEYEADTLWKEYLRDRAGGKGTALPANHPAGPYLPITQPAWRRRRTFLCQLAR